MEVIISESKNELGIKAASNGANLIRNAINENGLANIIVATGASQFEMLSELVKENIDWSKVTAFHLDEYIGIPDSHPASFRRYLKERFVDKIAIKEFIYVNGEGEALTECIRLNNIIANYEIDVAFIGIGENAHIAFNDPPADFEIAESFIIVNLDNDCRQQQFGEGWFSTFDEVPQKAISMSIKQILKAKNIICSVPDLRKSIAVKKTIESEICANVPSSILRAHGATWLYLDQESASRLEIKKIEW
jgi:glucosamine-6-phosphate deaminase